MRLIQSDVLTAANAIINVELHLHSMFPTHPYRNSRTVQTTIRIINHPSLSNLAGGAQGVLLTYHSVSGTPASAVVLPPSESQQKITTDTRILLALHGAGVMHTSPFWLSALPRPQHTWVLVVQGLTTWGLDWREASRADVCAALRALVLQLAGIWRVEDYCTTHDTTLTIHRDDPKLHIGAIPVIAIGHSNGGQGSLQLASLFPDCIPALIPAAGYTSARLYVSTQFSRGSLFTDTALQSIMRASLQGQDGDLVAGNLVLSRGK
jgi:pimeloyl-ACP methyl ester carboxylesterase